MPGEPLTTAGRRAVGRICHPNGVTWESGKVEEPALDTILEVEQEAVTRALRSIREQVEPVRALSEAAWPGPWIANENGHARWIHAAPSSVVIADFDPNAGAVTPDPNARFAAAAVNLVRDLLAILDQAAPREPGQ